MKKFLLVATSLVAGIAFANSQAIQAGADSMANSASQAQLKMAKNSKHSKHSKHHFAKKHHHKNVAMQTQDQDQHNQMPKSQQ